MPLDSRPSIALQQNLVTALCYDRQGGIVAALADATLFDGDYRVVADRAIRYWKQYDQPPAEHTGDLLAELLEDATNHRRAETLQRILAAMLHLKGNLNTAYVLDQLKLFSRGQAIKAAIIRAAHAVSAADQISLAQVEDILAEVLRARAVEFDSGTRLDDDLGPFLEWMETRHIEFRTDIAPLDDAGIVPYRGALMLFIAGKGRGKSWFLVNIGKQALILHKKVLHISLENDEMETRMRYYQALFAAPRRLPIGQARSTGVQVPALQAAEHHRVRVQGRATHVPEFVFADGNGINPELAVELQTRINDLDSSSNLIIKRFPNRTLSVDMLEAYIDTLEQVAQFTPDILLLDYAKLLKLTGSAETRRFAIGDNVEALRALAIKRNIAVVTADQLNRGGYDRKTAHSTHIGEDWSQVHTADIVLTHSATDAEMQQGLCRIYVDHARSDKDKFQVVLTQNFNIGQFVLDAREMTPDDTYFNDVEQLGRSEAEAEAEADAAAEAAEAAAQEEVD